VGFDASVTAVVFDFVPAKLPSFVSSINTVFVGLNAVVSHCRILSPDRTEWRLISATLCGWGRCFVADQLWSMTRIREEEECSCRETTLNRNSLSECIVAELFVTENVCILVNCLWSLDNSWQILAVYSALRRQNYSVCACCWHVHYVGCCI